MEPVFKDSGLIPAKCPDTEYLSLRLQIAQSRSYLYTLGPKVGVIYILGAVGYGCCIRNRNCGLGYVPHIWVLGALGKENSNSSQHPRLNEGTQRPINGPTRTRKAQDTPEEPSQVYHSITGRHYQVYDTAAILGIWCQNFG